jgi:hypothetical protein
VKETWNDALHYRVWARNLTFEPQGFVLFVRLYRGVIPEDLKGSFITFKMKAVRTKGGAPNALDYEDGLIEAALDISGRTPDLYALRFDLYQDDLSQDTLDDLIEGTR